MPIVVVVLVAAVLALEILRAQRDDLRREAGSRWLEGGVPIHIVRDWLGHTNVKQTSDYLAGTGSDDHAVMARYEANRAVLQKLAKNSQTGGRKRPASATRSNTKPNKTTGGRNPTIM